jgi:hypothetical protein
MTCPFCGAQVSSYYGFLCGSGPNHGQRSAACREREIDALKARIATLEEYAEALEAIGDKMKDAALTCDAAKWDARRARRPQP